MPDEKYPWLCGTLSDYQTFCSSEHSHFISEEEIDTFGSVTDVALSNYGLRFVYYKVNLDLNRDVLYGEDQLGIVERAFNIIGYMESLPPNVRSYHMSGIVGEDILQVYISRPSFNYWSTYGGSDRNTPQVFESMIPSIGDILYLMANNTFYEIYDVKYYDKPFGLQSHTYSLTMRVYKDTKLSIDNKNETLSNKEDKIYTVVSGSLEEQYEIKDTLSNEEIFSKEGSEILLNNEDDGSIKYNPNRNFLK